jgi:hypothetical protein
MSKKRPSVLEVAEILRKYDKHRLNRKIYKTFNDKDFESIQYIVDNGQPHFSDIISNNTDKLYILKDKKGNTLEFDSLTDMAEHFGFKAKNCWRLYIQRAGYEVLEILENHE